MHALLRWLDSPLCPIAFPSVSDRWFPAPEGEGPGVGTVLSFISIYLPLSPSISFPLITDPAPIPAPAWVGNRKQWGGLIVYSIHNFLLCFIVVILSICTSSIWVKGAV